MKKLLFLGKFEARIEKCKSMKDENENKKSKFLALLEICQSFQNHIYFFDLAYTVFEMYSFKIYRKTIIQLKNDRSSQRLKR